jgi:hypothetical protein
MLIHRPARKNREVIAIAAAYESGIRNVVQNEALLKIQSGTGIRLGNQVAGKIIEERRLLAVSSENGL